MIESLTEPPEGNMTYDECRSAWPDKGFWGNINVELYGLPLEQLAESVIAKRERAGKRALAFEISEDVPANWRESVPVVLETLEKLG
jgi:EAL domain-containing protein (putative c-di-GMP-specific phosphodiesterase class I)